MQKPYINVDGANGVFSDANEKGVGRCDFKKQGVSTLWVKTLEGVSTPFLSYAQGILVGKNALIDKLTTNIIQSAYGFPMHLIRAQRVKIVTEAFKTALQAGQALTGVWMS